MQQCMLLLLYANDVVIVSFDVDGMQRLLGALEALEAFCQSSGLTVNVDKT